MRHSVACASHSFLAIIVLLTLGPMGARAGEALAQPTDIRVAANDKILSDRQRSIIKHYVLREAKASIISATGEPARLAHEIESALKDAGAWVAVDRTDAVENGQTGLTVIYDHSVPADASIFLALQRAGLNPADREIPGAPVATIIVGP
jgi:hypothetical protein